MRKSLFWLFLCRKSRHTYILNQSIGWDHTIHLQCKLVQILQRGTRSMRPGCDVDTELISSLWIRMKNIITLPTSKMVKGKDAFKFLQLKINCSPNGATVPCGSCVFKTGHRGFVVSINFRKDCKPKTTAKFTLLIYLMVCTWVLWIVVLAFQEFQLHIYPHISIQSRNTAHRRSTLKADIVVRNDQVPDLIKTVDDDADIQ
jgi:hypothetical protein